ncbi:unnamed protein product [Trichogramma brassicae]|uniref:Uncharacterized protein n=1 Tax=Trichogramma brassicae TaxID=86971 RepID=A0A6H5IXI0_9HYME|nr:unnamed protein product [Trichogramma brassicae]
MYAPVKLPAWQCPRNGSRGSTIGERPSRTPLLHAWLKNTVTAGIWIPGARVPPNRVTRRLRTSDPSSAIRSRSSRASPRLILYPVRLMRHCKSHGGEPAKTCIATVGTV